MTIRQYKKTEGLNGLNAEIVRKRNKCPLLYFTTNIFFLFFSFSAGIVCVFC